VGYFRRLGRSLLLGVNSLGFLTMLVLCWLIHYSFHTRFRWHSNAFSIVQEPEKRSLGTAWLKLFGGVVALVLAVSCIILVRRDDQLIVF
jgi:hypothetical protein